MRIRYPNSMLGEFLKTIYLELFDRRHNVSRILQGLAGRDVRHALDMFVSILNSGHLSEEAITSTAVGARGIAIPEYRILRFSCAPSTGFSTTPRASSRTFSTSKRTGSSRTTSSCQKSCSGCATTGSAAAKSALKDISPSLGSPTSCKSAATCVTTSVTHLNTKLGIRRYPYNAQFPHGFGALGTGRYLYEPHNIGEIWAAALMEMARRTDRDLALQLVMDALKLTKPLPSFLDGRDAIIVALHNLRQAGHLDQGQHEGAWLGIWLAFAKFGMGPAAGSSGPRTDKIVADTSIGEGGWSRCRVCAGIFRPDGPSVCRNAQPHTADATARPYEVVVNRPDYPGEAGWRACGACGQLHLPDLAGGTCWAGGTHTAADRGLYTVIMNAAGPAASLDGDAVSSCDSLYFSGSASVALSGDRARTYRPRRWTTGLSSSDDRAPLCPPPGATGHALAARLRTDARPPAKPGPPLLGVLLPAFVLGLIADFSSERR